MATFVEAAGTRFRYEETGEDRDGTIIVLHGGRGIGDHVGEFAAYRALADRYRVIAYDQRGCGLSSLTPPYSFDRLADDVEAIRQTLVGKPVVLIGGSFGGMIALTYALRPVGTMKPRPCRLSTTACIWPPAPRPAWSKRCSPTRWSTTSSCG
jgi:proline iminopeptidase